MIKKAELFHKVEYLMERQQILLEMCLNSGCFQVCHVCEGTLKKQPVPDGGMVDCLGCDGFGIVVKPTKPRRWWNG
jgi:hypothetical protein